MGLRGRTPGQGAGSVGGHPSFLFCELQFLEAWAWGAAGASRHRGGSGGKGGKGETSHQQQDGRRERAGPSAEIALGFEQEATRAGGDSSHQGGTSEGVWQQNAHQCLAQRRQEGQRRPLLCSEAWLASAGLPAPHQVVVTHTIQSLTRIEMEGCS